MATIVSLILGAAGLVVAVAGYFVNQRAIADEWTREWAVQRPVVYPLALPEWTYAMEASRYRGGNARLLPLKNGGRGPALDLWGEVSATDASSTTYSREILSGPIAAGELLDARIVPHPGIEHWVLQKAYSDTRI